MNKNLLSIVGLLFLIAGIGLFATSLSVVDDGILVASAPNGGGSFFVEHTLDQGRAFSSLVYEISFDSIASEGENKVSLSPWQEMTVYDEDDDDDEEETAYIGLYKLDPNLDVYDFRVEARATGNVRAGDSYDRARAEIEMMYIDKEYPWDFIQQCTKDRRDECSNEDDLLVHSYRRSNGDKNYVILDDVSFGNQTSEKRFSIRNEEPSVSGEVFLEGYLPHDIYIKYDNFAFIVMPWAFERSASASITHPASVDVFYRTPERLSDLSYGFGDFTLDTFQGVQEDSVITLDVASQANDYCDRDKNIDSCTVRLSFNSPTGGVVYVKPVETLKIAELEELVDEVPDVIDVVEEPVEDEVEDDSPIVDDIIDLITGGDDDVDDVDVVTDVSSDDVSADDISDKLDGLQQEEDVSVPVGFIVSVVLILAGIIMLIIRFKK